MTNFALPELTQLIEEAFAQIETHSTQTTGPICHAVEQVLMALDQGLIRVCIQQNQRWQTQEWIKKAILLSFRLNHNTLMHSTCANWFDKIPLKTESWTSDDFKHAGFRCLPHALVRKGAYIGSNVVLMPSFVNIGAYVGDNTMIDTWATVGSCAQIGKNCHISGGVGIGGVLEPLQAQPVIIEDNCFIGARSEVAEGVVIGEGSVLSMGVYLSASTRIVDRASGKITTGSVPPYSVVVPGSMPSKNSAPHAPATYCAVIIKQVDAQTRSKTNINSLLREA